jgi:hypothetical protein
MHPIRQQELERKAHELANRWPTYISAYRLAEALAELLIKTEEEAIAAERERLATRLEAMANTHSLEADRCTALSAGYYRNLDRAIALRNAASEIKAG